MKAFYIISLFITNVVALAQSDATAHSSRLRELESIVEARGVRGLLAESKVRPVEVPEIPSQWHVDRVSKGDQRVRDLAAREFGKSIVQNLEVLAHDIQKLPAGDELYRTIIDLLDLSKLLVGAEGYGNLLLVDRANDLIGVGTARLIANTGFPLDRCTELLNQLNQPWQSVSLRARVLNREAGAIIFPSEGDTALKKAWSLGQYVRIKQTHPEIAATMAAQFSEKEAGVPVDRESLPFFDEGDLRPAGPATLVSCWDKKDHERLVNQGFGSFSVDRAKALAEFRRIAGEFPLQRQTKTMTERQKKDAQWQAEYNFKHNIKTVAVSRPEGEEAFRQALGLDEAGQFTAQEYIRRRSLASKAWQTFDAIQRAQLFDRDTEALQQWTKLSR